MSKGISVEELCTDIGLSPEESARRAGLRYVGDEEPGIRRKPWGRGFTFLTPEGAHVTDERVRKRIDELVIPPAWTDVWICADPLGHIQATGRDDEGRKQYIYHPAWDDARNRTKFDRLVVFGEALPKLRKHCRGLIERQGLTGEKVLAAVVMLLDQTLIRIGNKTYAERNGAFGLTTLRDRHVNFSGKRVTFSFTGKGGKKHSIELADRRLARIVRRCRDVPGYHLFQYYDHEGCRRQVGSSDVNAFLKKATGQSFTAKDFRTWGGTVQAAIALLEMEEPTSRREAEKQIVQMVKIVAERLGNTPAVCRNYYIHPALSAAHLEGAFRVLFRKGMRGRLPANVDREELGLLHVLRTYSICEPQ